MTDRAPEAMEPNKPAVIILAAVPVSATTIAPILWGLEEEGIPSELYEVAARKAELLAKQAADASQLGVGIAIQHQEGSVVLHHRDLPEERPLFSLSTESLQREKLRVLGINAARLVKGEPLVLFQDNPGSGETNPVALSSGVEMDYLARVIARAVLDSLRNVNRHP